MINKKYCPNCESGKRKLILDVSGEKDTYLDYLNSKGYLDIDYKNIVRQYWQCEGCGLVYRSPVLDKNEKEILYEYFRDVEFRGENRQEYFNRITSYPRQESENYEKCRFLEKYIPETGTLLDVGCGAGVFIYAFKNYFQKWEVLGIEPTEGFAEFAEKEGIKVDYGYLTENTYDKTFNLISLIHVLEHVDSPKPMLSLLKKYLGSKSLLYIESPSVKDIDYLPSSHDRFMSQHDVIFSESFLQNCLRESGYEIAASEDFISARKRNNVRILAKLL
ncbi:MAG: methyltransferase family protein [Parcubacteria group bacterium Gr01-1014_30]|nr:MAG: methyltransferase family protein [Parcubacteria group bacterium Gr01-1014_30]